MFVLFLVWDRKQTAPVCRLHKLQEIVSAWITVWSIWLSSADWLTHRYRITTHIFNYNIFNQSIKTHLYSAICRERIRGAFRRCRGFSHQVSLNRSSSVLTCCRGCHRYSYYWVYKLGCQESTVTPAWAMRQHSVRRSGSVRSRRRSDCSWRCLVDAPSRWSTLDLSTRQLLRRRSARRWL